MKTRESGMPDEATWSGFFSPERTLRQLALFDRCGDVVDFGCGYGTFTVPAAKIVHGKVYAIDVEPEMVDATRRNAEAAGVVNIRILQRDFVASGTDLPAASVEYAMLFNILHCEEPLDLLGEAWRVLVPGGTLAVMHWNYDPSTPRGPRMNIRPTPAQCLDWSLLAGFALVGPERVDLPPFHYGIVLQKSVAQDR